MRLPPITLNVLVYQEEGEWVALALEMDLRGYGNTSEEALRDLEDLVGMQISFSRLTGQPELVWKAAEPIWFERSLYDARYRLHVIQALEQGRAEARAGRLTPHDKVAEELRRRWQRDNGPGAPILPSSG
jgi:hypothetical protein